LFVGLVAKVVPLRALERSAHACALALSRLPRESVAAAKTAVWEGLNASLAEGLELERRLAQRIAMISSAAAKTRAAVRT